MIDFLAGARPHLGVDKVVFGRFKLERELGRGSASCVWLARDLQIDELLALKFLPDLMRDPTADRDLRQVTRSVRALRHENIVHVRTLHLDSDCIALERDYVEGSSVAQWMSESPSGWLEVDQVASLVHGLCLAVDYAWRPPHRIVHRELKPGNLLVSVVGTAKVLDFGIDYLVQDTLARLGPPTRGNAASGSLPYRSPQALQGEVHHHNDVYSIGVTIYELLTGTTPFPVGNAAGSIAGSIGGSPPAMTERRRQIARERLSTSETTREIPGVWEEVVQSCLENDPARRPSSTTEVARRLGLLEERLSDSAPMPEAKPPVQGTRGAFEAVARFFRRAPPAPQPRAADPAPKVEPVPRKAPLSPTIFSTAANPPAQADAAPRQMDDNVQFTVYRPRAIEPEKWHTLIAFAHLAGKAPDAPGDEFDPAKEVARQAGQVLGAEIAKYQNSTQDSSQALPREGTITFVPTIDGVTFNPPQRSFVWNESVHREEFRLLAGAARAEQMLRGRMSVYLGGIIVAEVTLAIQVRARGETPVAKASVEASHSRPYRKIFASYSHRDVAVVEQFERYAKTLGDHYLRDWIHLRCGEVWDDQLRRLIDEADVFQLFWSANSMRSRFVRSEWEYALSLQRPNFIRPTYWEHPLPTAPAEGLPPEALLKLQFQIIGTADVLARPVEAQGTSAALLLEKAEQRTGGAADRTMLAEEKLFAAPRQPPPPQGIADRAGVSSPGGTAWLELPDGTKQPLKQIVRIGRIADGNELVFDHRHISKRHAQIEVRGGESFLSDLNSTNGTELNGSPVGGEMHLHDGDIILLGRSISLRFRDSQPDSHAPSKPIIDVPLLASDEVGREKRWLLIVDPAAASATDALQEAGYRGRILRMWATNISAVIESHGGANSRDVGKAILASWRSRETTRQEVMKVLREIEAYRASSAVGFQVVLHHGEVPLAGEGASLPGPVVNALVRCSHLAMKYHVPSMLTAGAVHMLELEGICRLVERPRGEDGDVETELFSLPAGFADWKDTEAAGG